MSTSTTTTSDTQTSSNGVNISPPTETPMGSESSEQPNPSTGSSTQAAGNVRTTTTSQEDSSTTSSNQVEQDIIKEMSNFDNLLKMLSMYKDNPDFRGNPNDKNIEEIARVLSGFIGDDIDDFLSESDDDDNGDFDADDKANAKSPAEVESNDDKDDNNVQS